MKNNALILCIALMLIPAALKAQELFVAPSPEGWERAEYTHRQADFPKINAKGEFWFRFQAPPTAKEVVLSIPVAGVNMPMQKDADGFWNAILTIPKVGFQIYYIVVDGVRFLDPGTTPFYGNGFTGTVEVPSPDEDYYIIKDVPHGDVREHWFYSDVDKKFRRAFVYTPAGYDTEVDRRYPVLYLQHGAGEDESEWTHSGRAAVILDNLIAEGKAVPMIVVMNNDFVYRPGDDRSGRLYLAPTGIENFGEMFIGEAIPDIDAHYRTLADPAHRAMAGLSLGGMITNQVGLANSSLFAYYGIFSGGTVSDPERIDKGTVRFIFETCGSQEYPERIAADVEKLNGMGIKAASYVSPGTAHEWQTWRRSLHEFLPLIFK